VRDACRPEGVGGDRQLGGNSFPYDRFGVLSHSTDTTVLSCSTFASTIFWCTQKDGRPYGRPLKSSISLSLITRVTDRPLLLRIKGLCTLPVLKFPNLERTPDDCRRPVLACP
jgi:hypothetical protein